MLMCYVLLLVLVVRFWLWAAMIVTLGKLEFGSLFHVA